MKKNTILKAIGAAVLVGAGAAVSYGVLSEAGFNRMLKRSKKEYDPHKGLDFLKDKQASDDAQLWLKSVPSEDVVIHSLDDTKLSGQKIMTHPASNKWVILVHGYRADHRSMALCARAFDAKGYNCLLIDLRAHGHSEGKYCTLGWSDRLDLLCWIESLTAMHPKAEIVLYGRSLGATTCLNATGEKLGPEVKCCVSDCAFSNAEAQCEHMLKRRKGVLWLLPGMKLLSKTHLKFKLKIADTKKQLAKSKTPTLFIHGEKDQIVPFTNVFDNYFACSAKKELFTVSDADHLECINQENYWERVFRFIDRNMEKNL